MLFDVHLSDTNNCVNLIDILQWWWWNTEKIVKYDEVDFMGYKGSLNIFLAYATI